MKIRRDRNLFEMETKISQEMKIKTISFISTVLSTRNTETSYPENKCKSFREKRATNIKMRNLNFYTKNRTNCFSMFTPSPEYLVGLRLSKTNWFLYYSRISVPSFSSPSTVTFSAYVYVNHSYKRVCRPGCHHKGAKLQKSIS